MQFNLADAQNDSAFFDAVTWGDQSRRDLAGLGRIDIGVHFHRFDGRDLRTFSDGITELDVDGNEFAGQRADNITGGGRRPGNHWGRDRSSHLRDIGLSDGYGRGSLRALVEDFDENLVHFAFYSYAEFFHIHWQLAGGGC